MRPGAGGSMLVIDRDRLTRGDDRLVAHLTADEPSSNASLICALYLADPQPARCRRVVAEDTTASVPTELEAQARELPQRSCPPGGGASQDEIAEQLHDRHGSRYQLQPVVTRLAIPELRWCREDASSEGGEGPVSVREVVGALERYEPVRALTASAVRRHRHDPRLSVTTIAAELGRLNASRIVLNRGLREAVLAAVGSGTLSMSEIALRCGRVKRDRRGCLSGETTWLSRRIGLVCDGGGSAPTPWIRSDVLALVAREGLGVAPREVELA